ncbi:MAG: hypothetical protein JXA06_07530 [Bacteroidetes bacterium]|nr:hypothetical protein [Bacteroidota bacterium]
MKSIIYTAVLTILISAAAFSQTQDTTSSEKNRERTQQMKKDKFIDRDGDGICDRREDGLGFRKGKHWSQRQKGKNQDVNGKGTSGTVQPTGTGTGKSQRGGAK